MKLHLISLIFLALLVFSCSRKTEVQLYHEGLAAEEQKSFQAAVDAYEQVVRDHPTTAYAESSLARLAPLYTNEVKDPQKAVNTYERGYKMFPNSKQAPTMLFLAGFVYNNELHNIDSARAKYQQYLDKYPNQELAESAKFELANLGKEPNQVLSTQVAETPTGQFTDRAEQPQKHTNKKAAK